MNNIKKLQFELKSYELQQDRLYHIYEQQIAWLEFKHKRYGALNNVNEGDRLDEVLIELDDWYKFQIEFLERMAKHEWVGKTYEN